jgi:nucleoside-diphosphate-sugar epimerase
MGRTVVVTGGAGQLGDRVRACLLRRDPGIRLVLVDTDVVDLLDETGVALEQADVVVDLGSSDHDLRAERRESATEVAASTLDVAERLGADHVVFVSSAMVYGAHRNNPVPITEETALRPDVDFVFARQLASAEELVEQWRLTRRGRTTTVLRPAVALAEGGNSRLASALVAGLGRRFAEDDPPSQFLHLDDLADAVALAVTSRLDGVFNVAPDGWVAGQRVRALSGERPRMPLPERFAELLARLRWRMQRGPIPPGLRPYTVHPWVVSNGRLRAAGWTPTVTNEQTYVESTEAPWYTTVSPKRRQELALGGGMAALAAVAVVASVAVRRRLARRRLTPQRLTPRRW